VNKKCRPLEHDYTTFNPLSLQTLHPQNLEFYLFVISRFIIDHLTILLMLLRT